MAEGATQGRFVWSVVCFSVCFVGFWVPQLGALSHPVLGEGSPTKIDYRKKQGYPYSILSTGGPRFDFPSPVLLIVFVCLCFLLASYLHSGCPKPTCILGMVGHGPKRLTFHVQVNLGKWFRFCWGFASGKTWQPRFLSARSPPMEHFSARQIE